MNSKNEILISKRAPNKLPKAKKYDIIPMLQKNRRKKHDSSDKRNIKIW